MSFMDSRRRREYSSVDRGKLKDVKGQIPNQGGGDAAAVSVRNYKKSKSQSKLSSVPAAKLTRRARDSNRATIQTSSYRKSPLKSAREQKKPNDIRMASRSDLNRSESRRRTVSRSKERRERGYSGGSDPRESAPIIIAKDEQFAYKAPSSIHETVVNTLRREKDGLTQALQNQRDLNGQMGSRISQLDARLQDLDRANKELAEIQNADKKALL